MFDMQEQQKDRKAKHFKKERHGFFEGRENLRWHNLIQETDPNKLLKTYREKVFPLLGEINAAFKDSVCLISKPSLLDVAMHTINDMDFSDGSDRKGDISDIFTDEELEELYSVLDGYMIKERIVG